MTETPNRAQHSNDTRGDRTRNDREPAIVLSARPERRLIRPTASARHVDFHLKVRPQEVQRERAAVRLALVLDRSGSMAGGKLEMAKRAALTVLDRLDPRDTVAVVAYDDRIELLAEAGPASQATKDRLRAAIHALEPRANTALHAGWLTGCNVIVDDASFVAGRIARCFLLTDGLANQGVTDPEQIASDAAGLRSRAGIGTSTFGIGEDYDEALLGPMAVAGGGQFYHLRDGAEILKTFTGELGDLLATAATRVQLELDPGRGVKPEIVSQYLLQRPEAGGIWRAELGDLIGGEERHAVVRFHFPRQTTQDRCVIRVRLCWIADGERWKTPWQELEFTFAEHAVCDAEPADREVLHWVGMHHADRARLEASGMSKRGETAPARKRVHAVAKRIAGYAGTDPDLLRAVDELRALDAEFEQGPIPAMAAKENYYQSYRMTRGRPDYRSQ